LKGDLPDIVDRQRADLAALEKKLNTSEDKLKQSRLDRERADGEILALAEKIERYKGQQLEVKSNRQYDALTREIETAEQKSGQLARSMEAAEGQLVTSRTDADALRAEIDTLKAELTEREAELEVVNKEHEAAENELKHKREKIAVRLDAGDRERYDRIRKAKGGKAVVAVRRNACGGCFSRVPPQKILELRKYDHLFICEHCGRILISEELTSGGNGPVV
jgi:predicted  nucleic acid-binding Zn-ribbon protein